MAQANIFNNDQKIGLLYGASTCFAMWFCAMHLLLQLKRALKATIHGATFEYVARNAQVVLAIEDIKDEDLEKVYFSC